MNQSRDFETELPCGVVLLCRRSSALGDVLGRVGAETTAARCVLTEPIEPQPVDPDAPVPPYLLERYLRAQAIACRYWPDVVATGAIYGWRGVLDANEGEIPFDAASLDWRLEPNEKYAVIRDMVGELSSGPVAAARAQVQAVDPQETSTAGS